MLREIVIFGTVTIKSMDILRSKAKFNPLYLLGPYGGIVGLCWIDNYRTTHIYKYLLMSKVVVQSDK